MHFVEPGSWDQRFPYCFVASPPCDRYLLCATCLSERPRELYVFREKIKGMMGVERTEAWYLYSNKIQSVLLLRGYGVPNVTTRARVT